MNHAGVNAVVLTGGTETALNMLRDKPSLHLLAETGGKNATIVTAMADRDQAIKHVLHSAFSHAGQKCSATSLLLLEAEVYDDPGFKHALCDAVNSICVGPAWNLESKMGPLIRPPSGDLVNGLKVLEPGESWAVLPQRSENNPNLWSPGVKYGVLPGSYTHLTEFFGPVLGVMRFEKLAQAIETVNQTGYGLTSGLQSLDDREQEQWKAGIRAGNLYINRTTVGRDRAAATVRRDGQVGVRTRHESRRPELCSALLMDFEDDVANGTSGWHVPELQAKGVDTSSKQGTLAAPPPSDDPMIARLCEGLQESSAGPLTELDLARVRRTAASYATSYYEEFGQSHDHFKLIGQDNFRRYLPVRELRIRVHPQDSLLSIVTRLFAARIAGCRTTISTPPDWHRGIGAAGGAYRTLGRGGGIRRGDRRRTCRRCSRHKTDRIRYAAPDRVEPVVQKAAAETGLYLAAEPVSAVGRRELLWYVQEQSISFDYHRYGNLGAREGEPRGEVL